ncbi:hypothetical protein ABMA28_002323 [Loxostege sticticalis]|uniref:Nose resistant-to-fluoxetine protein N-terminal domain-containing protein n=1 Tax=Loxostege sticticalis TaxID=481309 RepID=A0ABD0T0J0_LOXSC
MVPKLKYLFILVIIQTVNSNLIWDATYPAIDQSLHEEAIDPVLCEEHINYAITDSFLRLQFIDSGIRTPKGILDGNTVDLGNYHQCLGINRQLEDSELQGKYCLIRVPLNQTLNIPQLPGLTDIHEFEINEIKAGFQRAHEINVGARRLGGIFNNDTRLAPQSPLASINLRVAVCVPKTCSTKQAIDSLLFNISAFGFEYTEEFCRVPNDKPWVAADYVAVVLLSLIGVLSLISTVYDVLVQFVLKNVVRKPIYALFSIYTNGQRLMNFTTGSDALHCVDGIRALAMIWVLIGHTTTENFWANPLTGSQWIASPEALWLSAAHITVDTFFTLSGLLVVYTTAGKLSGKKLLQNLHLFYLNRLLRMFPVLATGVLLEASLFNRVSDGPYWLWMSDLVDRCRAFWWSTLLHMQNYMNPERVCIGQTWYLAIDVQLHILSPLVLFWVLSGSKKLAWLALAITFVLQLSAATVYNFLMEFPSSLISPNRGPDEMSNYMFKYYVNTLTRASPYLVGMIIGYVLSLYRGTKVRLSMGLVIFNYAWATALLSFVIYSSYPILQPSWDNQPLDSLYNSFIRPAWALGLGWLIFACVHGYAGPINWLLSLRIWKLPARLSYAMYILHFGLMIAVNSSAITPPFFSPEGLLFKFLGHFGLVFIVAFVVVLFIEAPCTILFKKLLNGVPKKEKKPAVEPEAAKETGKEV